MTKGKKYGGRLTIGFTTEQLLFLSEVEKQNNCGSVSQAIRMIVSEAMNPGGKEA